MKITKKILHDHKIYNPHNLANMAGNILYIDYISADHGRGGHSAKWQVTGIKIDTDKDAYWGDFGRKTFIVGCRNEKQPKLQETIAWVKEKYNLDCSEKDPFGAYQVVGTLAKIQEKIDPLKKAFDILIPKDCKNSADIKPLIEVKNQSKTFIPMTKDAHKYHNNEVK